MLACPCGHSLEFHDEVRCRYKTFGPACDCVRSCGQVVDCLIEFERENARAWIANGTLPPAS